MGRVSAREEGAQALPVLRVVHGLNVVLARHEPELTLPARRSIEAHLAGFLAQTAGDADERARALLAAGRPACLVCGRPKNPGGHVCSRGNRHGRN